MPLIEVTAASSTATASADDSTSEGITTKVHRCTLWRALPRRHCTERGAGHLAPNKRTHMAHR
eukprot:282758-Alexandrium_andersonii.AAC.1